MLGLDTRASSKLKTGLKVIDAAGSHQKRCTALGTADVPTVSSSGRGNWEPASTEWLSLPSSLRLALDVQAVPRRKSWAAEISGCGKAKGSSKHHRTRWRCRLVRAPSTPSRPHLYSSVQLQASIVMSSLSRLTEGSEGAQPIGSGSHQKTGARVHS